MNRAALWRLHNRLRWPIWIASIAGVALVSFALRSGHGRHPTWIALGIALVVFAQALNFIVPLLCDRRCREQAAASEMRRSPGA